MTAVAIAATDGHPLAANRFDPPGEPRGSVVIGPAMAISQGFYSGFAGWLATQGFVTWTFDYRGTGDSWPGSKRGAPGTLDDWCDKDYEAVLLAAHALQPGARCSRSGTASVASAHRCCHRGDCWPGW